MFRNLLDRFCATADFDAVLDNFADQLVSICPPQLEGQMEEMERIGALSIDSFVGAREGLIYRIREGKDAVRLRLGNSEISVPAYAGPALQFALEQPRFAVRDLPGPDFEESGKLVLVRRLVREGVLKIFKDSEQ